MNIFESMIIIVTILGWLVYQGSKKPKQLGEGYVDTIAVHIPNAEIAPYVPALQPAAPMPGVWAACHLRLGQDNYCELAGVPRASTPAVESRLQELGATQITTVVGATLEIVQFQATSESVITHLSQRFPTSCIQSTMSTVQ